MYLNNNIKELYLKNIFIIDWDDTLFPTTWVNKNQINLNSENSKNNYKLFFIELDKTLSNFLESFNKIGDIYIVTNANIKWIETCLNILNLTKKVIVNNNIKIISARDSYSKTNNSPTEWKILTFQDILNFIINKELQNLNNNMYLNILSFGDALYEYHALINLDSFIKKKYTNINFLLKNIKFIEKPEFDYIIDQMQVVQKNQNLIINKLSYIDLHLK
jgi:hypothetical protein